MTGQRQVLTWGVLHWLQGRLPEDAFCLLGITMEDLYPEPSWNFVFGPASLNERVGVYSFARHDPAFDGEPRGKDYPALLLRRSMKVLTYEAVLQDNQPLVMMPVPDPHLAARLGLGFSCGCDSLGQKCIGRVRAQRHQAFPPPRDGPEELGRRLDAHVRPTATFNDWCS